MKPNLRNLPLPSLEEAFYSLMVLIKTTLVSRPGRRGPLPGGR